MSGYRIVRIPPTEGMVAAGRLERGFEETSDEQGAINIYAAMISASPPVGEELVEKVARLIANAPPDQDAYSVQPDLLNYRRDTARAILALLNGEG